MLKYLIKKRNKAQGYTTKETSEKGEFEIIQDQIDHAAKEMRGRKFVLDKYGKAVIVSRVMTESLPKFAESPQLTVKEEPREKESKKPAFEESSLDSLEQPGGGGGAQGAADKKKRVRSRVKWG